MDVRDRGVVVTGAGHGIGRAIAARLAAEGARVVVNDLDAEAAEAVARRIGGHPVPGDAASAQGVRALVAAARDHLGAIDVYVANAGVDLGHGLDTPEEAWARTLDVNVLAHVRAARELVPEWLESGGGRFVVTASAAGLLTMLGRPAYAVSKHAAVAFAEWLSITYGDRGVTVQVVCPQAVTTRMLEETGPVKRLLRRDGLLAPEQVAQAVWEGLQDDRFLILPHPQVAGYYRQRATDPDRWLAGMRRLNRRLAETGSGAGPGTGGRDG